MPLTKKYTAKNFSDLKGIELEIDLVKRFFKKFPAKKSLILAGPPGTGKTCLAYCLANETSSEIIEINASDLRNKEQISKIIGQASQQCSLFNKGKILLVDEIDGITRDDRGGLPEMLSIIEKSCFPIIITANDIWDSKFSDLRRKSDLIQLKELNYKIVCEILKDITKKENLNVSENILTNIAIKTKGDVRAAINDLQSVHPDIIKENIDERDKGDNIFNILKIILKNLPNSETLIQYDKVSMSLDEILLWIEENVPKEYKGKELYNAFESISKADVFRGRIYRQQHWRFLVYQNFFLSAGISAAKKQIKTGFTSYKKPDRILKIWLINQRYKHKKSISIKYAKHCHINIKRAMRDFNIIKPILQKPEVQAELKLDEKEIFYLKN